MKLKNVLFAGALALTLGACSSTPAASTPTSSSASSANEEVATEGHYTVSNVSGNTITDLYFYKTGSEEKGTNYAEGGLEKGATITVDITVDEAEAEGYAMTVEYLAEGAEEAVNAFVSVVTDALVKGDKVQLVGFGSFEVRKRAARKGRNPQTKEEIKIPASKAPVFKAGKALKDLVNKK